MKRLSFDLSIIALVILAVLAVPVYFAISSSCNTTTKSATSLSINTRVSTDTLTAVSGTNFPLHISVSNNGDTPISGGQLAVTVSREPKIGDFSRGTEFVVLRSTSMPVGNISAKSSTTTVATWRVPARLPSGVYRIDAVFAQNGKIYENTSVSTKSPFGNSAKIFISGEATSTAYFMGGINSDGTKRVMLVNPTNETINVLVSIKSFNGSILGDNAGSQSKIVSIKPNSSITIPFSVANLIAPYSVAFETSLRGVPAFFGYSVSATSTNTQGLCFGQKDLQPWAALIGGLGVVMIVVVVLFERRKHLSI